MKYPLEIKKVFRLNFTKIDIEKEVDYFSGRHFDYFEQLALPSSLLKNTCRNFRQHWQNQL